jgi:hypothetical protein
MDKTLRPFNGPVHMGFGSKMAYRVNVIPVEDLLHQTGITNISLYKDITSGIFDVDSPKVFRITGIGQFVDINNPTLEVRFCKKVINKIAADKTTATGNH